MIFIPFTDHKSKQPVFINPLLIQGKRQAGFFGTLLVFSYKDGKETEYVHVTEEPDEVLEKILLYSAGS